MRPLNILIVGAGGREHALAWKLAGSQHVAHVFVAPGNGGTAWPAGEGRAATANVPIPVDDLPALRDFALRSQIGLTVVGPEAPLAAGIVDVFGAAGLKTFGPSAAAARIEASKADAKAFMRRHNIPTAAYQVFARADLPAALDYIDHMTGRGARLVVKASGLAAGKGVIVCDTPDQAVAAARQMLDAGQFGEAGDKIVIEERLAGPELSVLAFCDGQHVAPMPPARDHKRAEDGDAGPNTGGMGAFAPVPGVDAALLAPIEHEIILPTINGLAAEGTPYVGVLYAGLMLTEAGPKVLEFNCRLGDPETQAILPLLESDLAEICLACIDGRLADVSIRWSDDSCMAVTLAAAGYPGAYAKGGAVSGPHTDTVYFPADARQLLLHAGTARNAEGRLITAGGRVMTAVGRGADLGEARANAYAVANEVQFVGGVHFRRDIGGGAMGAAEPDSAYAQAGVNIDAGNRATRLMADAVRGTYGPQVLAGIGAFGGLYSVAAFKGMDHPVLVASTDGVGTKTKVASRLGRWEAIGADLVNHCVNDILVQGARPLFFLDYVAASALNPEQIAAIVGGVAEACRAAACALLGGETAEMPGVYQPGEIDLVGTIIGVVEKSAIIDGARVQPGDVILGLPSSGLHTNGYALARRALAEVDWATPQSALHGQTVGDMLLAVHRSYAPQVDKLRAAQVDIRGLAHITGGGLIENPPRILPDGVSAHIRRGAWPEPPIFHMIQHLGGVSDAEMFRVFNMGLGMLVIVPPGDAARALEALPDDGYVVGEIVPGPHIVKIRGI
jgi:phosphoribosylamine--glycine ligase/phosphoribosylformylglycinamidine cyclo-ligase